MADVSISDRHRDSVKAHLEAVAEAEQKAIDDGWAERLPSGHVIVKGSQDK